MTPETEPETDTSRAPIAPSQVRVVRLGHGANCSSIGSVVDTLFVTALLGGAVFAAVMAGLARESVEVVGRKPEDARPDDGAGAAPAANEDREAR